MELPDDPVMSLPGIYPKEMKTRYGGDICIPMLNAALFLLAKI